MKKIYLSLFVFLMAFLLLGCQDNDAAFEAYLLEKEPLSAEVLDEKFAEIKSENETEEDIFTDFKLANTKITFEVDNKAIGSTQAITSEMYLWQEDKKLYLGEEIQGQSQVLYVDFNELKDFLNSMLVDGSQFDQMKPSEMYQEIVENYAYDLGIENTIFTEKSLDELLSLVNFKYEDFEVVENGKYKVKNEVLYAKLLILTIEDLTVEDIIEMLSTEKVELALYVYFDGKNINTYELNVKDDNEITNIKLNLHHEKDKFIGLGFEFNRNQDNVLFDIKFKEGTLEYNCEVIFDGVKEMSLLLNLSDEEFVLVGKEKEEVKANVKLEYSKNKDNEFMVSGNIEIEDTKLVISSGVEISNNILAGKDMAYNIIDLLG